jgi:hypothetical protein
MNEIGSASPLLINLGASKIKLAKDIKIFMYSIEINKFPPSKITTEHLLLDADVCFDQYSVIDFLNHISASLTMELISSHNYN